MENLVHACSKQLLHACTRFSIWSISGRILVFTDGSMSLSPYVSYTTGSHKIWRFYPQLEWTEVSCKAVSFCSIPMQLTVGHPCNLRKVINNNTLLKSEIRWNIYYSNPTNKSYCYLQHSKYYFKTYTIPWYDFNFPTHFPKQPSAHCKYIQNSLCVCKNFHFYIKLHHVLTNITKTV